MQNLCYYRCFIWFNKDTIKNFTVYFRFIRSWYHTTKILQNKSLFYRILYINWIKFCCIRHGNAIFKKSSKCTAMLPTRHFMLERLLMVVVNGNGLTIRYYHLQTGTLANRHQTTYACSYCQAESGLHHRSGVPV